MTLNELMRRLATGGIVIGLFLIPCYILWLKAAAIVNMPPILG